ncbi:MAG: hypothetical protein L0Z53_23705 [Acidobacteriales bacterium]|nr:hypothetical protein [Terriglobales bacterium]
MSDCCSVQEAKGAAPRVMVCPACGGRSKQVQSLTVKSLVRTLPLGMPAVQYYFCEAPECDVVYFPADSGAPLFRRADLWVRVGVKESNGPIPVCYCFGFTRESIQEEIQQAGESTVAGKIKAEVQAGNCACELKNPSGKCCLGDVTRVVQGFLRRAREKQNALP